MTFTDLSSGTITAWAWDFDNDGDVDSTLQSPTYAYTAAGTYTVKLTVSNGCGSDDETKTGYITVGEPPTADFSADHTYICVDSTVTFTDLSSGTITAWAWDFDNDGDVDSTLQSPTYAYTAAGTYTVKLTVSNGCGSDDETKTGYITVGEPPTADFSADHTYICVDSAVTFTDLSSGTITAWAWDFDNDGDLDSTLQHPTHAYTAAGTYTVKLTVSNGCGSDDETKTVYITVGEPPTADFSADHTYICVDSAVTFTELSSGTITAWAWDFDSDGDHDSTLQSPTYTYAAAGTYTVKLTVSNGCGSDDETKTDYITVGEPPAADFEADQTSICVGSAVTFTDLSTGTPTAWAWDFDSDGATIHPPVRHLHLRRRRHLHRQPHRLQRLRLRRRDQDRLHHRRRAARR